MMGLALVVMVVDLLESTSIARWGLLKHAAPTLIDLVGWLGGACVCVVVVVLLLLLLLLLCAGGTATHTKPNRNTQTTHDTPRPPLSALARKNGYALAYNQEIVGLGLANFAGAAFSAYTTTGSFSRSAVNNASGARTQLAGFVTGVVVMLVLLFMTPVFAKLP